MKLHPKLLQGGSRLPQIVANVRHPRRTVPLEFIKMAPGDGNRAGEIPRITCNACEVSADLTPVYGPVRVDAIISKFKRLGWRTDGRHARKTFCPTCSSPKRLKAATTETTETTEAPKEAPPMPAEATSANGAAPPQPRLAVVPTPPTANQRASIRRLLDGNFDDAKGVYLGGYSDQRIGAECGVPWATVKQLRETAYGPIKSDPQVETLFVALDTAKAEVIDIDRSLATARQLLDAIHKRNAVARETLERLTREAAEVKARYRS